MSHSESPGVLVSQRDTADRHVRSPLTDGCDSCGSQDTSPPSRPAGSKTGNPASLASDQALAEGKSTRGIVGRIDSPDTVLDPVLKSCLKATQTCFPRITEPPKRFCFSETASEIEIPSHRELSPAERLQIYWQHEDMQNFVRFELRRRKAMGIKSISALCPTAGNLDGEE